MKKARVYRSSAREFECRDIETGEMLFATALGNLLKKDNSIVVGDIVNLDDEGVITSIEERSSEIYRYLPRVQKKKITAANCDLLIILNSVSKPEYKRGFADRFLLRASQWGIKPVMIFNKMDQFEDQFDFNFEVDRLKELGVECFEISAKFPETEKKYLDRGTEELKEFIKGRTAIFLGQSGVGKSKTISLLAGMDIELKTKEIGKAGKGSHTTTWSEIIDCGDFSLIDSPGIRSFSLEDLVGEELMELFPDLEERAVNCKFSDCQHSSGTKGCAFHKPLLDPDSYEGQLVHSRLESYLRVYEEITENPAWSKK
ncbi:MAG: ribosome small subunit-dependent GTPase A [Halobacteriovorax sp.]|nr:ribosome small subunit-dependent GTPase A [Halobacteriovorax sp.]